MAGATNATAGPESRPDRSRDPAGGGRLHRIVRRGFFRSRLVRKLVTSLLPGKPRSKPPDLIHLALFDERPNGPVQRDEALLLYSLVRVIRPQTILEIGFLKGLSTFNFLRALDGDGRMYSLDLNPRAAAIADDRFGNDPRFTLRIKSQTELGPDDVDGRSVDFAFLDASHDLALNQQTFERLQVLLAPDAIVAVHDTGTVPRQLLPEHHWWHLSDDGWLGDERQVMPGERAFVNWVLDAHPEYSELHLHSRRTLRCGLTLIQRSVPLQTRPL